MKSIIASIMFATLLFSGSRAIADDFYMNFFTMNPDHVSSISITNRSSNTNDQGSLIVDVTYLAGTAPGDLVAWGGGSSAGSGVYPGDFFSAEPEWISTLIYDSGWNSAWSDAVSMFLYGVTIDSTTYNYSVGNYQVSAYAPEGTKLSINSWTDSGGSFHLEFSIEDE